MFSSVPDSDDSNQVLATTGVGLELASAGGFVATLEAGGAVVGKSWIGLAGLGLGYRF